MQWWLQIINKGRRPTGSYKLEANYQKEIFNCSSAAFPRLEDPSLFLSLILGGKNPTSLREVASKFGNKKKFSSSFFFLSLSHAKPQISQILHCIEANPVTRWGSDLNRSFLCSSWIFATRLIDFVMNWRYKAGLFLIGTVVVIWVSSAEVTQVSFWSMFY